MKKKFLLAAAAALIAAGLAMPVMAQESPDFASTDGNRDGSVSFDEAVGVYPGLTQAIFDQADTDKNGSLSETEFAGLEGLSAAFEGVVTSGGDTSASSGTPPSPPSQ